MLNRDKDESKRLDFQHEFMRALGHGNILHPSIPRNELSAVADVGTGTGVWLNDLAQIFREGGEHKAELDFVGFDMSPEQFPSSEDRSPEVDFVVHDMTTRFPPEYHGRFDLVNLRFLVYALKEIDLKKVIEYVTEILRKRHSVPRLLIHSALD